ncbi:MAG TPA: SMC family ATPase [Candidatus Tumulicola sp.]|jgi:exonuclease SbcC
MKPIAISLQNFRSFRTKRDLSFEGKTIFGLVGDTGVGKTSVLEAITYALYNRSTWEGRGVTDLIAKGTRTMSVEFAFEVDGQKYTIVRQTGQAGTNARIWSEDRTVDTSNADAVTEQVRKILHMDAETFLHTVLLPQGRHAELLTAKSRNRNEILMDLFRLKDLAKVLELTRRHEARAETELRLLGVQRAECGANPHEAEEATAVELTRAKARLKDISKAVVRDTKLEQDVAKINEQLAGETRLLSTFEQTASILDGLATIATKSTELTAIVTAARQRALQAQEILRVAQAGAEELRRVEADADTLRTIQRSLEALAAAARTIEGLRADIERHGLSIAQNETQLAELRDPIKAKTKERVDVERAIDQADKQAAALRTRRETLETTAKAFQDAQSTLTIAQASVAETRARIEGLRAKLSAAQQAVSEAAERRDTADDAAQRHRVGNEIAAIAGHLHVGDDCPICHRALPKAFQTPRSEDLEAATKAATEERTAFDIAQRHASMIEGELKTQPPQLARSEQALAAAEATLAHVQNKMDAARAEDLREPELIASELRRALEETEERLRSSRETISQVDGELSRMRGVEIRLSTSIESARMELTRVQEQLDGAVAKQQALRDGIPQKYRAKTADEPLNTYLASVAARIVEAERVRDRIEKATMDVASSVQVQSEAESKYTAEVGEPRVRAFEQLKPIAKAAGCADAPKTAGGLDAWSFSVWETVQLRIADITKGVERHRSNIEKAVLERAAIREKLDGKEPRPAETAATIHKTQMESELERVHGLASRARECDAKIERLDRVRAGLAGLKEALGGRARAFPAYATAQRQQRLLQEANVILREMSKQRYEFTGDFDLLDYESNEQRPSQTLSGGEKFLASLALSLGAVEIASNSGKRIGAIFLDEGFDSLDVHRLRLAMLELRRRAEKGRMIGVITHVEEVKEFLNDTIVVSAGPDGSYFTDTDAVSEDDGLVQGLVSHLSDGGPLTAA